MDKVRNAAAARGDVVCALSCAYVGVLNACSRAGLLDGDGLRCFDRMLLEYKVTPNAQRYGCMVDGGPRRKAGRTRAHLGSVGPIGCRCAVTSASGRGRWMRVRMRHVMAASLYVPFAARQHATSELTTEPTVRLHGGVLFKCISRFAANLIVSVACPSHDPCLQLVIIK